MKGRPAAGGGRWIEVAPERVERWIEGFAARHGQGGPVETEVTPETVRLRGADGAVAELHVPFPPLEGTLAEHAARERRVGVLLVRLGGYASGVFHGTRLIASKVGSRQVHGRSAAGGWSQQRFARRRENQAATALGEAADVAARVLGPAVPELDAVILGGDRKAVDTLRGDPRLTPVFALAAEPFLAVPDPRLAVLEGTPRLFRAVRVRIVE
ncbi:acVLRF1 family peptidyl-tRNA hydrolase [Rhizohabitans arisaemae]|uniref:acVLRF1 family peptidyl-tRNA hydrolase n=1 Tax=Rhizohabitans arisaemae TaxID=2720610 RepID=UPI0024B1C494|nr:acVLRF1 family peptidyl-tRNA hydrolase [Rhizohabitans arisaemae]